MHAKTKAWDIAVWVGLGYFCDQAGTLASCSINIKFSIQCPILVTGYFLWNCEYDIMEV